MVRKKKEKSNHGIAISLIIILVLTMILSAILSLLGVEGEKVFVVNNVLESSLVTPKSIFSVDGMRYFFGNVITNLSLFEPLIKLIIVMIGISIGEASGLFKVIFTPFKNFKLLVLTFIVLFTSIIMNFLGNDIYVILIPLSAVFYRNINRNPILGVMTAFVGSTVASTAGLIFSYDNYLLGLLTEASAIADIDKNYIFSLKSNLFISLVSMIVITLFGTFIIQRKWFPKYGKIKVSEEEEMIVYNKKAQNYTFLAFSILLVLLFYMIIPNLPGSGILLNPDEVKYVLKLLSDASPFKEAFVYLFSFTIMVLGFVYGKFCGNIKNTNEYSLGLAKEFDGIGYVFVLMFLLSQIMGVISWTNIGEIIATRLITSMSVLEFSGILLILLVIVFSVIMSFFMPDMLSKWTLMSPIIVPLFMRSNITPDFTQFIFEASSSIGSSLTPLLPCFIVMVGFAYKYTTKDDDISFSKMYKTILPVNLFIALIWVLIIVGWYVIGLPLGISAYPTL